MDTRDRDSLLYISNRSFRFQLLDLTITSCGLHPMPYDNRF